MGPDYRLLAWTGAGVVGHAGAGLLRELADRLGLIRALGRRAPAPGAVIQTRPCCGTWW
jgi:hypothetical protein